MSLPFSDEQITEAEIDLACEIAIRVIAFLKAEKLNVTHEAIMRRIELAVHKKADSAARKRD